MGCDGTEGRSSRGGSRGAGVGVTSKVSWEDGKCVRMLLSVVMKGNAVYGYFSSSCFSAFTSCYSFYYSLFGRISF